MSKPIRILHVLGTVNLGGAESRIMDLYRQMDRERIQFDFAVHTEEKGHFDEEIEQLGGRIYRVPRFRLVNFVAYRKAWRRFFAKHHDFQCVQGHITSTAAIYLPIAKRVGIPLTVAHARNAGVDKGLKNIAVSFMRRKLWKKADRLFTCSHIAGLAAFGEKAVRQGKVEYIPNAIKAERFCFNQPVRERIRQELGLEDQYVLGHVGRFDHQKNHGYLIRIFFELQRLRPLSQLLLLGEGPGMEGAKQLTEELGITKKVHFLGNRSNISDYYQAMDYFVFPSFFEGLPGTVVEAQAAGLKCLISDAIAKEVQITGLVKMKSISVPPVEWARAIVEEAEYTRDITTGSIKSGGFDVVEQAKRLAQFYESGYLPSAKDEKKQ